MGATNIIETSEAQNIEDDVSQNEVKKVDESVDLGKLAALRAKSQVKQEENKMAAKIIAKKERSLNIGVVGSGQAGGNLAATWFTQGYDAIAVNTAATDLKGLAALPDSNKLLLNYGIGGASKELSIGAAAAESHRGEIAQLINEKLSNSQINVLCFSLGGGSGAGSASELISILSEVGKPIIVITILPMDSDDVQTKANSLETLTMLASMAKSKKIANLIVVDNAKIESIYHDANQFDFFNLANKSIVEPLDVFNTYSCLPSSIKSLDGMELTKILLDGEGLSIYGELSVSEYTDDTAIAEAVINNLNSNLLAGGFDIKQSKYVGFIVAANKQVWAKVPASSINYTSSILNDLCGSPKGVFKGIYTVDIPDDVVKVYSFFSGLGLPSDRIEQLKKQTLELQAKVKNKEEQRTLNLQLDAGANETISAADKVRQKIAAKSSTFGKFVGASTPVDRRK